MEAMIDAKIWVAVGGLALLCGLITALMIYEHSKSTWILNNIEEIKRRFDVAYYTVIRNTNSTVTIRSPEFRKFILTESAMYALVKKTEKRPFNDVMAEFLNKNKAVIKNQNSTRYKPYD